MSYYYKYKFESPQGVFAIVKEELKSYFDTGAVDDLLFPTYVDKCLKKLGKSSYPIKEYALLIDGYEARLPDNFDTVREAWMCLRVNEVFNQPNSFYAQAATATTIQIAPVITNQTPCTTPDCMPDVAYGTIDLVDAAVYKTTYGDIETYRQHYLLKPGNISARKSCNLDYTGAYEIYGQSPGSSGFDSFDIRDNKFITNFVTGVVHLIYYSTDFDDCNDQMIPDNYRIKEFIELFIKYKVFETLTNQTNDETFNQLQQKMLHYKQLADEAFIMADIEIKKATVEKRFSNIKTGLKRLNMYELPNRSNNGRRRNN